MTAEAAKDPRKWGRTWPAIRLGADFLVMVLMFILDLRDIWYKTRWIGPEQTYAFMAVGTQFLQPETLETTFNRTNNTDEIIPRLSGWSSFLSKCESLRPISTGPFFLHAMGINCDVGRPNASHVVPEMIFVSSVRSDTLSWSACRLLREDRKPTICHSRLVKGYSARYNLVETPALLVLKSRDSGEHYEPDMSEEIARPWTAQPESDAEAELLEVLDVISMSSFVGSITCVEGFAYEGPGHYTSSLFGCGSPTYFRSAFVGHHAPKIIQYQQNKAWITSDVLTFLGLNYIIRENCWSKFHAEILQDGKNTLSLVHATVINYSSAGILYTALVFVDVLLFFINLVSVTEIVSLVLWPLVAELRVSDHDRIIGTSRAPFTFDDYKAILTCPLFRSLPVALLMLVSQFLTWMITLPGSVIWTWTEDTSAQVQAYLSTVRIWVIPMILLNIVWDAIVFVFEKYAYAYSQRAYVTVYEVFCITTLIGYYHRQKVFSIGGAKYDVEIQRRVDFLSFKDHIAFGNVVPEFQDALQNTSLAVARIMYDPLLTIVGWSTLSICGVTFLRFLYHVIRRTPTATELVQRETPARRDGEPQDDGHHRLPIEELLDIPIRARSLVRNARQTETIIQRKVFLRPSSYVEHGIIMEQDKLRTRRGFFDTILYAMDAHGHAEKFSTTEAEENAELPPPADAAGLQRRRQVLQPMR